MLRRGRSNNFEEKLSMMEAARKTSKKNAEKIDQSHGKGIREWRNQK